HIRPVDQSGPDSVSNGLALCRSAHWLFDKGLLSIDADYRILKSRHCRGSAIERFLNATGRINVPDNPRCRPHPDFLLYHRECIFLR
ncbi:MAG: HNH endonuclease, partial [Phyllobacterium sp.]